ncbi:hypothetical protein JCM10213_003211 [Rhodosporidiobolus nylandii]
MSVDALGEVAEDESGPPSPTGAGAASSTDAQPFSAALKHPSSAPEDGIEPSGLPLLPPLPPLSPSTSPSSGSVTLPHLSSILDGTIYPFAGRTATDDVDLTSTVPPTSASPSSNGLFASGVTAPASPQNHDLRQLALLQALAARQQHPYPHNPSSASFLPPASLSHNGFGAPFHLPQAPPSTPTLPLYAPVTAAPNYAPLTAADMPPASHNLHTNLDGLNLALYSSVRGVPQNASAASSAVTIPGVGSVTAEELLAARASLDLWSSLAFSSPSSPGLTLPPITSGLPGFGQPASPAALPDQPHHPDPLSRLDWSALYPHHPPSPAAATPQADFSLPPTSLGLTHPAPFATDLQHPFSHPSPAPVHLPSFAPPHPADTQGSQFSFLFGGGNSTPGAAEDNPSPASQPTLSPPSTSSGFFVRPKTGSRRSSRPNAGAKGRALAADGLGSASEDGGGSADGGRASSEGAGGKVNRELMTAEDIEEDKRRRNTEASARFRRKKKLRDAELQQSTAQLREKVSALEREKDSLKNENRWLRDIVAEKAEASPDFLTRLRRDSAS